MVKRLSIELGGTGVNNASEVTAVLGLHSSNNTQFNTVGIGVAPGTPTVHIRTNDSTVVAPTASDDLVIENDVDTGLSIITPAGAIASINFGDPGDNDVGSIKYDHATDDMLFRAGGVHKMRIDGSTARVSIGLDINPSGTLHVATASSGVATVDGTADDIVIEHDQAAGISILTPSNATASLVFGNQINNKIGRIAYSHQQNAMTFKVNGLDRILITQLGNVAIGEVQPAAFLHIKQSDSTVTSAISTADGIFIEKAGSTGITIATRNTDEGSIMFADPQVNNIGSIAYSHADNDLIFRTISTPRMVINSSGIDVLSGKIKENGSIVMPSGSILMYGSSSAPAGWFQCNGQAINRTSFSALFSVIGSRYGDGNGTTTFNVPDLGARMPMGNVGLFNIGATSGSVNPTVNSASVATTSVNGDHTHLLAGSGAQTSSTGDHTHVLQGAGSEAQSAGAHTHVLAGSGALASSSGSHDHANVTEAFINTVKDSTSRNALVDTSPTGAHTHTLAGSTTSTGAHAHSLAGLTGTASIGNHLHTLVGSTGTASIGNHAHTVPIAYTIVGFIIKT